jgi:hypothetical protein
MNRVSARLTKRTRWRKASIATTFLPFALAAATAPSHAANANALRDCIAGADNSAAIGACESQQQARLKTRIERLSAAIRTHLDGRQRLVFDRSSDAWQAFVEQEQAMLKLSLGLRRDGLGPALQPGAITRLYEQREQQLREHLHNLSSTQPADSGH